MTTRTSYLPRKSGSLSLISLFCLLIPSAPSAADPRPLYHLAEPGSDEAARSLTSHIDLADPAQLRDADAWQLPLPDGTSLVAYALQQAAAPGSATLGTSWHGWIPFPDGADGRVTLTLHKGLLFGAVFAPRGSWIIEPDAAGDHHLRRVDPEGFAECSVAPSPGLVPPLSGEQLPAPGSPLATIDVLTLYTIGAKEGAGGVAQIEGLIANAVAVTNDAFVESDVAARLEVVHIAELDLSRFPPLADLHEALLAIQDDAEIAALRDLWSADLVAAVFEGGGGLCGYAHAMDTVGLEFASEAYSISVRECAVANLSFPHEIGHNLGCRHNPEDSEATPDQASFPWSFGHYVAGNFRTIMSLGGQCGAAGCPRLPNFSNPQIDLTASTPPNPQPSGIENQRDNHRTMNATASIAAQFRVPALIFRDGFESGSVAVWLGAMN